MLVEQKLVSDSSTRGSAHILAIVNPVAGAGLGRAILPQLSSKSGGRVCFQTSDAPGHASELAQAAAEAGYRVIVAVGGDGTVNEVARSLVHSSSALGIIPIGSGNGLARHLRIPLRPFEALECVLNSKFMRIDVGEINGRQFFCTAGIGFDAHIARHFATCTNRGFIGYTRVSLSRYLKYRPRPLKAQFGATSITQQCYLLAFANASQYGNNAYIAPHADLTDGILDLCWIDSLPFWRALRVAWAMMRGTLPASGAAEFHSAEAVHVITEEPFEYHVDGEFVGEDRVFNVSLERRALEVAV